jgi:hypothetical protein
MEAECSIKEDGGASECGRAVQERRIQRLELSRFAKPARPKPYSDAVRKDPGKLRRRNISGLA